MHAENVRTARQISDSPVEEYYRGRRRVPLEVSFGVNTSIVLVQFDEDRYPVATRQYSLERSIP